MYLDAKGTTRQIRLNRLRAKMALSLYTGKRLLVLDAHGAIDNRTAGCVAGFGTCNGTHKLMLLKIPAMHPTRTTNRKDQSTTCYTTSDRRPRPRSTAPQTQPVTKQKGNTFVGHVFVR